MTPECLETLEVLEVSQTLPKRKDGLMDTQLVTKQIHLHQWTDMVRACRNSGLTTLEWCRQNNIKPKTYYYRFKIVKEAALEASCFAEIAPPVPFQKQEKAVSGFVPQMTLDIGGMVLGITEATPKELILQMMEILKDA